MQFGAASKEAGEGKPASGKLGANEYSVFEQIVGEGDRKSDLKYFHLFKNNACYEFALDVDTTEKPENLAQLDRADAFDKREKNVRSASRDERRANAVDHTANARPHPSAEVHSRKR